ncbi:MAG: zf-TFIIB domain-containing protein [Myxococcota bacterium]
MSLLGEKCTRCGKKRTRKEFAGVPTCDACHELLEKRLEAAREAPRACPIDGDPMKKEVVSNVIIDRCPRCKGVWPDGGGLDLLRGAIEAGVTDAVLRGVLFHPL